MKTFGEYSKKSNTFKAKVIKLRDDLKYAYLYFQRYSSIESKDDIYAIINYATDLQVEIFIACDEMSMERIGYHGDPEESIRSGFLKSLTRSTERKFFEFRYFVKSKLSKSQDDRDTRIVEAEIACLRAFSILAGMTCESGLIGKESIMVDSAKCALRESMYCLDCLIEIL